MVEKVFISPNRVRAYGNIVNMKTVDDFELVDSVVTEITDTVYGSTSKVFSMEVTPYIQLTATNPYMVSGETTDLVVSLVNEFGSPLRNKTVTLSDGTSSYNGITNNQGAYTLSDVSVSQDTTFTATYSSVSDSIVVEYCTMVDYGVTGKSRLNYWYWNSNFGSGSVDDNGTIFTAKSTSSYLTISALTTESYPNVNIYLYDFPFTVEFDIVSYNDPNTTGAMSRVRIYDSASKNAYWNFKDYGIGHYKIVCTEGSQKLYFNGVEQSRKFTFTTTDTHWDCSFQTYGNIKFRNFRIREG